MAKIQNNVQIGRRKKLF